LYTKGLDKRDLTPDLLAEAIDFLGDETQSDIFKDVDDLKKIRELFIPDVDMKEPGKPYNAERPQWKLMQMKREASDPLKQPWARPEEYAWAINKLDFVAERLECWIFAREVPGQVEFLQGKIDAFNHMMDGILNSRAVPTFLCLVLEVGNYMNGGNSRLQQADGFDFELASKIGIVKDPQGIDIRSLIFEVFIRELPGELEEFLNDINPLLCNLRRKQSEEGAKDKNGIPLPPIIKEAIISIEGMEKPANSLHDTVVKLDKKVPSILKSLEKPDSPFTKAFEGDTGIMKKTMGKVVKLVASVNDGLQKFEKMKEYFNISSAKYTSSDFCEEWDNLIVPANLLLKGLPGAAGTTKEELQECWSPKFFRYNPLDALALRILYRHTTWSEVCLEEIKRKHREKLALEAELKRTESEASAKGDESPSKKVVKRRFQRRGTKLDD